MIKFLLAALLLCVTCYGYYLANDTFLLSHITSELPWEPAHEPPTPLQAGQKEIIANIMQQPFYYLSKGCQCYVFISKDGEHILKLPKFQRYRNRAWVDWLAFIPALQRNAAALAEHKRGKGLKTFASYSLAFKELAPQTGLEFIHLKTGAAAPPPPYHTLKIYDKLGNLYLLDSSLQQFLLQRRCTPLSAAIDALMASNDIDGAKQLIDELIALFIGEYRRGLVDQDPLLLQNTGVLEGHPIHIDAGRFIPDESFSEPARYNLHLKTKLDHLQQWLEKYHPTLAQYLCQQVKKTNVSVSSSTFISSY